MANRFEERIYGKRPRDEPPAAPQVSPQVSPPISDSRAAPGNRFEKRIYGNQRPPVPLGGVDWSKLNQPHGELKPHATAELTAP